MRLAVLVPSFRDEVLERLLTSMERSQTGSTGDVIVLDNGLQTRRHQRFPTETVRVPQPFNFSQAFNVGVRQAAEMKPECNIVSICDDVEILSADWLLRLRTLFMVWPQPFGVLSLEEERRRELYGPVCELAELDDVALGPGLAIPWWVLERVGLWDERYIGYGFDDFDYGVRCFHAGYRLGVTNQVLIRNERQASAWQERLGSYEAVLAQQEINFEVYHMKWLGAIPPKPWVVERPRAADHMNRVRCACP